MTNQLEIVVTPTGDHPTAQVLATATLLALEWAAPYANVTIGHNGVSACEPSPDAVGGLLRLSSDRKERLEVAARSATQSGEKEIQITEKE